jgi:hypothetical protein
MLLQAGHGGAAEVVVPIVEPPGEAGRNSVLAERGKNAEGEAAGSVLDGVRNHGSGCTR